METNTEVKAIAKGIRIVPQKTRLVIDLIRGKDTKDALAILANQPQRASRVISKVLESATSNAVNNFNMNEENLYVKECFVDEALVIKRIKFDSRGRTGRNDHKTSHITVVVTEK